MLRRFRRESKRNPFHYINVIPPQSIELPSYEPASPQAAAFHQSPKQIRWLFGGDRSGKSGTCVYDNILAMRAHPGDLFWTITLTSAKIRTVWLWYKVWLAPHELDEKNIAWQSKALDHPKAFTLNDGTRMEFFTAASGAGVISGDKVRQIHIDEDPERETPQGENIFQECLSRIVQGGRLLGSTTPVLGKNWMHRRLIKEMDPQDIDYWFVSLQDNKYISQEEKDAAKRKMPQDQIARRFDGRFTSLSGACFKEFRSDVHNLKECPSISAAWRRIRVIDFGFNHFFYCMWIAEDPQGRLIVYDEYHSKGRLLKVHAEAIYEKTIGHRNTLLSHTGEFRPIESTIADHEAQQRHELTNPDLGIMRLFTIPAIKHVDEGIQKVNRYLMIDEYGQTRIAISPDCPVAQDQCESYHFKVVKDGNEVKEIVDKINDEAPDTLRYGVEYFDQGVRDYKVKTKTRAFETPAEKQEHNIASLLG